MPQAANLGIALGSVKTAENHLIGDELSIRYGLWTIATLVFLLSAPAAQTGTKARLFAFSRRRRQ